jgi:hypothetical protein
MADGELWTDAIGAWVPLAELLETTGREFDVSRQEAARILREPLETAPFRLR